MAQNRFYGNIHSAEIFDDHATPEMLGEVKASPLDSIGATGVRRSAGIIDEEFLPALRGRKAVKVFKEMSLNDPIVGSLLFTFEQLLRQTNWTVEGASQSKEDQDAATFLEQCMDDMSSSWGDTIAEILSFLTYGWSYSEIVYKRRVGPWEADPRKRSKHSDGRIGWRKIEIRAQETLQRWLFDKEGSVKGMVQIAPPLYKTTFIPIERALLFRFRENKGSPEGISMLRNAYRPWFMKKRLEEFEAIGIERDLAGMPVAKVPASYMTADRKSKDYRTFQAFKQMVRGIRRDEHEGIVLPQLYDKETKQPLFEFELMSAGGSRQFDTSSIIQRYEQRILMTVLADFIMVGHQGQGSYALHVDKTGIFRAALNAVARHIADVFNRHAIPKLFAINGWKPQELPKIVPSNVDAPNLTELAGFMSSLAGMGMEWFPDPDMEKYLRKIAGLPDLPDDKVEMRRVMADQMDIMSFAETQMQALGAQQKAQMTAQGMSPEQAEAQAQAPTPEQAAQEEIAQAKGHAIAQQDPDVAQVQEEQEQQEQMQQEQAPEQIQQLMAQEEQLGQEEQEQPAPRYPRPRRPQREGQQQQGHYASPEEFFAAREAQQAPAKRKAQPKRQVQQSKYKSADDFIAQMSRKVQEEEGNE